MFVIDDEAHCELQEARFHTRAEAISELARTALMPCNEEPYRAPCAIGGIVVGDM